MRLRRGQVRRKACDARRRAVVRRLFLVFRSCPPQPREDHRGPLQDLGAWTYLLVGALAFLETGAFVGLVAPGETVMLLGGAVAGQGAIDI